MFVVFNVDALAQASDFRIDRIQVVILCWMQDSNPKGLWNRISSRLNARWQTDWDIEDQIKTWTRQPVPMISELGRGYRPYGDGESDERADTQIIKWFSVVGQMRDYNLKHYFVNFSRLNDVYTPQESTLSLPQVTPCYHGSKPLYDTVLIY